MKTINLIISEKQIIVAESNNGFYEIFVRDPQLRKLECKFVKRNNQWGILGENPFTESEIAIIGLETENIL